MTAPTCTRHPSRETWVSCQRCGKPICPDCMNAAPVGFQCPGCVAEGRKSTRQMRIQRTPVMNVIIGICVGLTIFEFLTRVDLAMDFGMARAAIDQNHEYYRFITAMFLHGGIIHLAFNMLVLSQLASQLEPYFGSPRFTVLYLGAGIGGGIASYLFNNPYTLSVGASGAIFGLMGAYIVVAKRVYVNASSVWTLIGINLALGFALPGIDWHAHVGGLLTGLALASVLAPNRR